MNEQEFEELTVRFGADLGVWPAGKRQQAESFLASPKGQSLLRAQQTLDAYMRASDPMPGDDTAFLARLMDIPQSHAGRSRGFFASLFGGLPSVGVVASQVAVYALVLVVGVVVGMQGGSGSGDADSVDLSAQLFASNADFYLEDE